MLPSFPSLAEIEVQAFNRNDRSLYAFFETGQMRDWDQYSLDVFYAIVRGAEIVLAEGKRPQVVLKRVSPIIEILLQRVAALQSCPRVFFFIIDRWTALLFSLEQHAALISLARFALERKIRRFPGLEISLRLRLANSLMKKGNPGEARAIYRELALRPYLIQNTLDRYAVTEKAALAGLLAGEPVNTDFKKLLWHSRSGRVALLYRTLLRLLLTKDGPAHIKLFVSLARLGEILRRVPGAARTLSFLRRGAVFAEKSFILEQRYNLPPAMSAVASAPAAKPEPKPILITRTMGGLGDVLMMTPGLSALKAKHPDREIHFAVPENFHMLFEGNTDVVIKDIHGAPLAREAYHAWYDLSDCPAAKVESLTAPNVKRNRIDIFAQAVGVRKRELDRVGRIPRYTVTEQEKTWAENLLREKGVSAGPLIGVQLYSADMYRDYPHMPQLVEKLASQTTVLLFHSEKINGYAMRNVHCIDGVSLRRSAAVLSCCSLLIGPDSSFLHLASALKIPVLVLSGPVCGKVRTRNYPYAHFLDMRASMPCVPCWRNENSPCALTGNYTSECLKALPVEKIVPVAQRILRQANGSACA